MAFCAHLEPLELGVYEEMRKEPCSHRYGAPRLSPSGLHSASIVQKRMRCQASVLRKSRSLCPPLPVLSPFPVTLEFGLVAQAKQVGADGILFYLTC